MRYSRWDVYRQSDGGFSAVETVITDLGGSHVSHEFIPCDTRKDAQDLCDTLNDLA